MEYMSAKEAAIKWKMDKRNILRLCKDGRIDGAKFECGVWHIPSTATKPLDGRVKSGKYLKAAKKIELNKKAILIADDNELTREMLKTILSNGRFEFYEAENGEQVLDIIEAHGEEISLLLLDLVMPKKDGIQVLKEMEQKGYMNFIPVIMVTGEATADTDKLAYDLGVSEIIYKPFASPMVYRRAMNIIQLFQYKRYL